MGAKTLAAFHPELEFALVRDIINIGGRLGSSAVTARALSKIIPGIKLSEHGSASSKLYNLNPAWDYDPMTNQLGLLYDFIDISRDVGTTASWTPRSGQTGLTVDLFRRDV